MKRIHSARELMSRWLLPVLLIGLAGCATPERRSRQYGDLFERYSPKMQQQLLEGRLDIGYNPHMVYVAAGEPDYIYRVNGADEERMVWLYTEPRFERRTERVDLDLNFRDSDGRYRSARENVWLRYDDRVEVDALRVIFEKGRVIGYEMLLPNARAKDQFGKEKSQTSGR